CPPCCIRPLWTIIGAANQARRPDRPPAEMAPAQDRRPRRQGRACPAAGGCRARRAQGELRAAPRLLHGPSCLRTAATLRFPAGAAAWAADRWFPAPAAAGMSESRIGPGGRMKLPIVVLTLVAVLAGCATLPRGAAI